MNPFESRASCSKCGIKGYLKIIKNEDTNNQIRKFLNEDKNIMYNFELNPPILNCYCQECGKSSKARSVLHGRYPFNRHKRQKPACCCQDGRHQGRGNGAHHQKRMAGV